MIHKFYYLGVLISNETTYRQVFSCYYEKKGDIVRNITEEILNTGTNIPSNWAWSRLKEIIVLLSGRDLTPSEYSNEKNEGVPYITGASNFLHGNLLINRWTNNPAVISRLGDLLITCKGTIGEMAINRIGNIHIARQVMAINSIDNINLCYIRVFLQSYLSVLTTKAKSMIPGISRDDINEALIPIPPLKEQSKIVDMVVTAFKCINGETI